MPKITKKTLLIGGCTVLTLLNVGGLAYAYSRHSKPVASTGAALQEIVKPKIAITNAKKRSTDVNLQGQKLGTGTYKSEALKESKIKQGDPAQLAIASNEQSGGHFVLAFLNTGHIPAQGDLDPGWTLQSIANDRMWAPGACSAKPTFLLGGKYIFIDDGKTNPDDKFNSYIVFNMGTSEYRYFGGSNFTDTQGKKEQIMLAVNENDKLVFYIDPADDPPSLDANGNPNHTRGKDHKYVIRREIDPATLDYTDYSLPFNVPSDLNNYSVNAFNNGSDVIFRLSAPYIGSVAGPMYEGKIQANSIKLSPYSSANYDYNQPQTFDTELELSLDSMLRQSLSSLAKQTPFAGSQYKTLFSISELGSYKQLQFLNVSQRYGNPNPEPPIQAGLESNNVTYSTPLIFDKTANKTYPMISKPLMRSFQDYVNLGVF